MPLANSIAKGWPAVRQRLLIVGGLCATMVIVHMLGWIIAPIGTFGIHPRVAGSAWMIATSPFIHADLGHLGSNLAAFAVLAPLAMARGVGHFTRASLIIIIVGGMSVWLFGRDGNHIGASGWIFGLWSLAIVDAWFDRSARAIAISIAVILFYGGMIWGVLPNQPGVSFEGHFFGAVAGGLAAWLLRPRIGQGSPRVPGVPDFWS